MYIGITKLEFSPESSTGQDFKAAKALCQSIKARFKVISCTCSTIEKDGVTSIAYAAFGSNESQLGSFLEQIADFCEGSGFGRIENHNRIIESLDHMDEEDEDD